MRSWGRGWGYGWRDRPLAAVTPALRVDTRQPKVAAAAAGRGMFPGEEAGDRRLGVGGWGWEARPRDPALALTSVSPSGTTGPPSPGKPSSLSPSPLPNQPGPAQALARQVGEEARAPRAPASWW